MSDLTVERTTLEQQRELEEEARYIDNAKFATWLYLASEVIIFSVLIGAYAVFRLNNPDIVHEVHDRLGLSGILLVTFNTFLLLTSSWAMVMGLRQIQRGDPRGLIRWLGLTAFLGTTFVGLQYVEYVRLAEESITLNFANDAFGGFGMHFYTPTAFHGAHVIVGVFWCLWVMYRAHKGDYTERRHVGVEVFGLYWHFVDVVWILLFTIIYLI
jgi:heme/copper-type cytochrome/quinol oxidase subunit 3